MKAFQKGIALVIALGLILSGTPTAAPTVAFAEAVPPMAAPGQASDEGPGTMASNPLKGEAVVKVPVREGRLVVTVNGMELVLTLTEETLAIDSKTGLPASLSDLKADDTVYVYYSPVMTKSLPPQSHAIAIVTGVEKDRSHAELFTVREILSSGDGVVRALNTAGDLIVTFSKDTRLTPYRTKEQVSVEDIRVGTQLFIWYEIVAMSYPGQTGAVQAVLVGQEEGLGVRSVYTPFTGAETATVTIGGKAITFGAQAPKDHNGILMVPLRRTAEGLGFKVVWNPLDQSILLDDGEVKTTLHLGEDSYFKASSQAIGLTQSFSLGAAPTVIDGSTYVPAALFNLLYSDNDAVRVMGR